MKILFICYLLKQHITQQSFSQKTLLRISPHTPTSCFLIILICAHPANYSHLLSLTLIKAPVYIYTHTHTPQLLTPLLLDCFVCYFFLSYWLDPVSELASFSYCLSPVLFIAWETLLFLSSRIVAPLYLLISEFLELCVLVSFWVFKYPVS